MDRLLRIDEAAEYLATTKKTLYTKVARRQIAAVKIGRSLRFKLSDLNRLIKAGERPALRPVSTLEDPGDGENGGER